jgi:hypothetical protein
MNKQKTSKNSQQEQMGDKTHTMSSRASVAKNSDYTGMSDSNQKHTPVDDSQYECSKCYEVFAKEELLGHARDKKHYSFKLRGSNLTVSFC